MYYETISWHLNFTYMSAILVPINTLNAKCWKKQENIGSHSFQQAKNKCRVTLEVHQPFFCESGLKHSAESWMDSNSSTTEVPLHILFSCNTWDPSVLKYHLGWAWFLQTFITHSKTSCWNQVFWSHLEDI